ncbi:MAG: flagellar biosynthetic protein FliO [Proteobacteria bacterium]|nr:flagellar biosynthetic protein FliO [Pseudomonadota bacterium]
MLSILSILAAEMETVPASPAAVPDFAWLFIKMLLLLGAVCMGAIIFLKYGAPRMPIFRKMAGHGFARIIARQAIEPRKNLYLVAIGKRYLVIGTSDHAINAFAELTEDEARALGVEGTGGKLS